MGNLGVEMEDLGFFHSGSPAAEPGDDACKALKGRVDAIAYCLSGHMLKEEDLVFRMAEAMLGPERLAELGARMAALD